MNTRKDYQPIMIEGSKITSRERECMELVMQGYNYKEIASLMGFKNNLPVNSLMARLHDKTGCNSMLKLAIKATKYLTINNQ